ncbi:MAG: hypothetical protein Homavirus49_3 [Homavirus sp.]|uniref:Uncharacterized protein n=1 Tax=Homavirus sp. TaxID=2487769 RepID=A0A3G5A5W5_9VIRU|nr:MAG: hypothetical protein Homavirus49_3 [Homavirus sp.]
MKRIGPLMDTYLKTPNHDIIEFSSPDVYKDMMVRCGLLKG